jgi:DNA-3-methyladenine glycosylase I
MAKAADSRCSWCLASDLYREYHDQEWGVPCYDSKELFELFILEGAQAGLSWITILNKRESYRRAFDQFVPEKIARYKPAKVEKLLKDPGIVRNRLKVEATVNNAIRYVELEKAGQSFAELLWSFVDYKPVQNNFSNTSDVPAKTTQSEAMSKGLKKAGFKFVGSTICYAFMQASGMVNDHALHCPAHQRCTKRAAVRYMPKGWPGRLRQKK